MFYPEVAQMVYSNLREIILEVAQMAWLYRFDVPNEEHLSRIIFQQILVYQVIRPLENKTTAAAEQRLVPWSRSE